MAGLRGHYKSQCRGYGGFLTAAKAGCKVSPESYCRGYGGFSTAAKADLNGLQITAQCRGKVMAREKKTTKHVAKQDVTVVAKGGFRGMGAPGKAEASLPSA